MTTLGPQLESAFKNFAANAPEAVQKIINAGRLEVISKFSAPPSTIQVNSPFPAFNLPNASGTLVSSDALLAKGPLLVTFYRGSWCPYCNLALRGLQLRLDEIRAKGVELVAVSPMIPDESLSMQEKNELKFEVLSDVGKKLAEKLGILWTQPDEVTEVLKQSGHDLSKINGDASNAVPIPATFLIGQDGVLKNVYFEADYSKRIEPDLVLGWINGL